MAAAATDDELFGEEFVPRAIELVPLTCTEWQLRDLAHVAQVPADLTWEGSACREDDAVVCGFRVFFVELVEEDLDNHDVVMNGLGIQALEGGVARGGDDVLLGILYDRLVLGLLVALLGTSCSPVMNEIK